MLVARDGREGCFVEGLGERASVKDKNEGRLRIGIIADARCTGGLQERALVVEVWGRSASEERRWGRLTVGSCQGPESSGLRNKEGEKRERYQNQDKAVADANSVALKRDGFWLGMRRWSPGMTAA